MTTQIRKIFSALPISTWFYQQFSLISADVKVTIQGPNQLTVGEYLELTCRADTHPDINYSWTIRQGQTEKDFPNRQRLEKTEVQKSDEGMYT